MLMSVLGSSGYLLLHTRVYNITHSTLRFSLQATWLTCMWQSSHIHCCPAHPSTATHMWSESCEHSRLSLRVSAESHPITQCCSFSAAATTQCLGM